MTIYEALNAVKRDLGAISKGNTMKGGSFSYKYRSIDDVLNQLHPILVQHGVIGPVPNVIERTQNGKKTIITSGFTFFHTDGSSVTGATVGEGDDPGDKGANKASTGALKTFLTQTLAIPFDTDDPDHYPYPSSAGPSQKEEKSGRATISREKQTIPESATDKAVAAAKPAAKVNEPAPAASSERTCATCTYTIGSNDPIKRQAGKYHHKACIDGAKPASVTSTPTPPAADDISSIIDSFESN